MSNRTKRTLESPERKEPMPKRGAWFWLTQPSNQKALRFIGAAIAAAIAMLASFGLIHKTPETPETTKGAVTRSTRSSEPAPPQNVIANDHSTAIVNQGSGSVVTVEKP
ncbi:hypothetical protein BN2475_50114 [Paraburkholderia ribeironis]|uniref:Uncharacterized protein n=2 Tax=Paraburkholderia ribeironis TaxID=1247936 RepID=A0A1N7RKI2_9BURK|nr:hypothetical protein BN2475_50114 [Paraburkholderia ribeironis]